MGKWNVFALRNIDSDLYKKFEEWVYKGKHGRIKIKDQFFRWEEEDRAQLHIPDASVVKIKKEEDVFFFKMVFENLISFDKPYFIARKTTFSSSTTSVIIPSCSSSTATISSSTIPVTTQNVTSSAILWTTQTGSSSSTIQTITTSCS